MRLLEEVSYDLDFRKPRVTCEEGLATIEHVQSIVMLTDSAVTVHNGSRYVTVVGENFLIREICEGRLTVEGKIQKVEFL